MSFKNKSTVSYQVWSLDVWGDEGDWTVNDRSNIGAVSVRTDQKNKDGSWSVSNKALTKALVEGHYLKAGARSRDLDIDGEDDGVLNLDDSRDGYPVLQLEYASDHPVESGGLFSEGMAKEGKPEMTKENPAGMSNAEMIGLGVLGLVVVGGIGYWLYTRSQAAQTAAAGASTSAGLPVVYTNPSTPMLPSPGTVDTTSSSTGAQLYDPNLGGSGAAVPADQANPWTLLYGN